MVLAEMPMHLMPNSFAMASPFAGLSALRLMTARFTPASARPLVRAIPRIPNPPVMTQLRPFRSSKEYFIAAGLFVEQDLHVPLAQVVCNLLSNHVGVLLESGDVLVLELGGNLEADVEELTHRRSVERV